MTRGVGPFERLALKAGGMPPRHRPRRHRPLTRWLPRGVRAGVARLWR